MTEVTVRHRSAIPGDRCRPFTRNSGQGSRFSYPDSPSSSIRISTDSDVWHPLRAESIPLIVLVRKSLTKGVMGIGLPSTLREISFYFLDFRTSSSIKLAKPRISSRSKQGTPTRNFWFETIAMRLSLFVQRSFLCFSFRKISILG